MLKHSIHNNIIKVYFALTPSLSNSLDGFQCINHFLFCLSIVNKVRFMRKVTSYRRNTGNFISEFTENLMVKFIQQYSGINILRQCNLVVLRNYVIFDGIRKILSDQWAEVNKFCMTLSGMKGLFIHENIYYLNVSWVSLINCQCIEVEISLYRQIGTQEKVRKPYYIKTFYT